MHPMKVTAAQIKFVRSLHSRKGRLEEKLFIAEGEKNVEEAILSKQKIELLFASRQWIEFNAGLYENVQVIESDLVSLGRMSTLTTPNHVISVIQIPDRILDMKSLKDSLTVVLDEVKDPGNMGTIIRLCDWFGIPNILCTPGTVDCYNPKVVQASMGSVFRVPVIKINPKYFFKELRIVWPDVTVYGAVLNGDNIYRETLSKTGLILLGNESNGISAEMMKNIGIPLLIPPYHPRTTQQKMLNNPVAESLNVGVATAIILSQFRSRITD
jgi:RNA methyltransferase, TrmH family